MAKARTRLVPRVPFRMNGVQLDGVEFVVVGECNYNGLRKQANGKALLKADRKYMLVKFADPKAAKRIGIPKSEFSVYKPHMKVLFMEEKPKSEGISE